MSNEQHDAGTGKFVSNEYAKANPSTTVQIEGERHSPWLQAWYDFGQQIEAIGKEMETADPEQGIDLMYSMDNLTVQAMIHVQILKRVDQ